MSRTLMMTEQEVKNLTPIGDNVDSRKICHWIAYCQDVHIQPIIREECYNDLLDDIAADTVPADWQTVLDGDDRGFPGLKEALAWWVLFYAYLDLYAFVSPTGVQIKTGEKVQSVDSNTLNMLREQARGRAQRQTDQLFRWLCENDTLFPCFKTSDNDYITPQNSGYSQTSGIVLDTDDVFIDEFARINNK